MRQLAIAVAVASMAIPWWPGSRAHAATMPCEDMLKELRTAKQTAKLSDPDAKTVADLESKGIERCNADDDKRADDFFAQALKIIGK